MRAAKAMIRATRVDILFCCIIIRSSFLQRIGLATYIASKMSKVDLSLHEFKLSVDRRRDLIQLGGRMMLVVRTGYR